MPRAQSPSPTKNNCLNAHQSPDIDLNHWAQTYEQNLSVVRSLEAVVASPRRDPRMVHKHCHGRRCKTQYKRKGFAKRYLTYKYLTQCVRDSSGTYTECLKLADRFGAKIYLLLCVTGLLVTLPTLCYDANNTSPQFLSAPCCQMTEFPKRGLPC